ncbi:MAG: AbrB/MazE/SpoVT family DNA-binding domain-containing protein [Pseudomonadota bacterium]
MRVSKWGNSLAIRLPKAVVDALELREGDEVRVTLKDQGIIAVDRKPTPAELLARLDALDIKLPADFVFDRDEANAR